MAILFNQRGAQRKSVGLNQVHKWSFFRKWKYNNKKYQQKWSNENSMGCHRWK